MYNNHTSNPYAMEPIVLNIYVDITDNTTIEYLPYGIFDFREQCIIFNGVNYFLSDTIPNPILNAGSILDNVIFNIWNSIYSAFEYFDNSSEYLHFQNNIRKYMEKKI
jgi:hypothetical protein